MKPDSLSIFCIAIGGTGMAPLACLLQELGHRVTGSDGPLYPPMSTLLERAGIRPSVGFDEAHLDRQAPGGLPDLVIVGNAVHRQNPEALKAESLGLPLLSMPQAIARFLLAGRRPLVITGTHGKTTTTTLAAWVYSRAGREPGFLIGGLPLDLPTSFQVGHGERFVIEGDEYNAAYFDRGAKFLHYRGDTVVLTSVEYDHADLYPSFEALKDAYRQLVRQIPRQGRLIAWGDSPEVRQVAAEASCEVIFYGFGEQNALRVKGGREGLRSGPEGSRFTILEPAQGPTQGPTQGTGQDEKREHDVHLAVTGEHNVLNSLAVWAAARGDGLSPATIADAFATFRGAKRRLEELGTAAGVTVVDDFAHHPTAVAASLKALRSRYPGRRLVALFEPRSLTAGRSLFQQAYVEAFSEADRIFLAPLFHEGRLPAEERLDRKSLVAALGERGIPSHAAASVEALITDALTEARPGDVLVTMSSGSFEGACRRLLEALSERQALLAG